MTDQLTTVKPAPSVPLHMTPARLISLGIMAMCAPMAIDLYLPALPTLTRELHTSAALGQVTMSGTFVGLAVGQLIIGPLSDRTGRRRPLLLGLACYAIASLLCAIAPSIWFLVCVRVIQGVAGASGIVIGRAIIRDIVPVERLGHYYSLMLLVSGCGPIIAPLIGSGLLHLMPWRGLFVFLTCVGVALFLLALMLLPESLPDERRHAGGLRRLAHSFHALTRDRHFVGGCLLIGFGCGATFTYISLAAFVFKDQFSLSAVQVGSVIAVNAVGMIGVSRTNAILLRRHPPTRLIGFGLAAMLLAAIGFSIAASTGAGLPVLLPALFVTNALVYTVIPNATAIGMAGQGGNAGTASAVLGAFQFGIGAAAGPLVSLIAGHLTITVMAVSMSCWALLAGLVWLALLARRP